MDNEKEQGLFWLPDDPEERVAGVVTLNAAGGTVLTTYGRLGEFGFEDRKQDTIHGLLAGSHVKLVNCLATNQRMTLETSTADETTWHCQFAFRGSAYRGLYRTGSNQSKQSLNCSGIGCQVSRASN